MAPARRGSTATSPSAATASRASRRPACCATPALLAASMALLVKNLVRLMKFFLNDKYIKSLAFFLLVLM
jgi:hypothetical protein